MKQKVSLSIGAVAKQSGVRVETVRFYESKGLLKRPARTPSGYRIYLPEDAQRVRFIKRSQELGFSLREIKELLELRVNARATCGDVKKRALSKLSETESKIRDLQRIKRSLTRLSKMCSGSDLATRECPILDSFERDGDRYA